MGDSLTIDRAKELLFYETPTGNLLWRKPRGNVKPLDIAGYIKKSNSCAYRIICIDGKKHRAHRLVWLLHYGKFPNGNIDHINGNGLDNTINNLRDVSHGENLKNLKLSNKNTSGFNGVRFLKQRNKWVAKIQVEGKCIHLGCFDNKKDAVAARIEANKTYLFHENHGKERVNALL